MLVVFGAHTDLAVCGFWAHTDPTDLTDFFVGGKSHGIVWWGSRGGFWSHTDPTDLTDFFCGW